MKTVLHIKILMGLIFLLNINLSAYKPLHFFTPTDSTIQTQDSSLQKKWEISSNTFSTTNILTSPNWFYFTSDSGLVYCYDFAGKEKWTTEVLGVTSNKSVLYKDLILTATIQGDLYSINSNNGEVLQVVGIGEDITSDLAIIELSTAASKTIGVVLGTSEGNIFCYDAFTFELLWEKNICNNHILSTPLVINDKIIFLSSNSSLYCVNSKSGSLIWKYESSGKQNISANNFPVSDGKNILSLSADGKLFSLDLLAGKKIWSSNTKEVLNQFYITSDKQKIFLIDSKGLMTIYSTKNGKELSKIDYKKSELYSFNIAEDQENTLIGFSDGSLYILDPKFVSKELISANQIPITSLNVISKDQYLIKDVSGKITFYKIN
jgi:outer membrane protein assembly factor BamB